MKRNPDDFVELPTRYQVWKDGEWVDVVQQSTKPCNCGWHPQRCTYPNCERGV